MYHKVDELPWYMLHECKYDVCMFYERLLVQVLMLSWFITLLKARIVVRMVSYVWVFKLFSNFLPIFFHIKNTGRNKSVIALLDVLMTSRFSRSNTPTIHSMRSDNTRAYYRPPAWCFPTDSTVQCTHLSWFHCVIFSPTYLISCSCQVEK